MDDILLIKAENLERCIQRVREEAEAVAALMTKTAQAETQRLLNQKLNELLTKNAPAAEINAVLARLSG